MINCCVLFIQVFRLSPFQYVFVTLLSSPLNNDALGPCYISCRSHWMPYTGYGISCRTLSSCRMRHAGQILGIQRYAIKKGSQSCSWTIYRKSHIAQIAECWSPRRLVECDISRLCQHDWKKRKRNYTIKTQFF